MAHSKEIIIKCPACAAKFEAVREEDATFVSCPDCDMQVRISGVNERRRGHSSTASRRSSPATSIPAGRQQTGRATIGDLSAGRAMMDFETIRKRKQQADVETDLVIDDDDPSLGSSTDPDTPKPKSAMRSSIERRAAKLEERAAKLEELAAKLGQMKVKSSARPKEERKASKMPEEIVEPPHKKAELQESPQQDPLPTPADEDVVEYEKVEVRSSGERRRLRKAPKAEVPAPRGTPEAPRYVENLRTESNEVLVGSEQASKVEPSQDFESRKISEGAEWRRHLPSRTKDPGWETDDDYTDDEIDDEIEVVPRRFLTVILSIIGLFALFACFQFILSQAGWLSPDSEVVEAPALLQDPGMRWSRAEMLEKATPVINRFLTSKSNEEALQYVRRAGKVAFMMKKHYAPTGFQPINVKSLGLPDACHLVETGFFVVPVVFADQTSRGIALEIPKEADGEWLVDWESWEGYSEMTFQEMRLRQPKSPVIVRCYMLEDHYYNFAYADSEKYVSFKLTDHNRQEHLWGYIDRLSESYRTVKTALAGTEDSGSGEELVTLRVRFPEDSKNPLGDQVEIAEMVTFGWVVID